MKAVIYTRVSTDEQAEHGYSLAAQEAACRERAAALGATEMEVYSDPGFSGATLDRSGLTAAREALRRGGVGLFVCLDPDRLSRNLAHQLLLTDEIERAGARLEFVNFEWRNTAEGRLFYSLRGAIAEYERAKIAERTIAGKWAKARAGRLPGWCSMLGYRYDPDADTLEVDEEQAETVRRVFTWYVTEDLTFGEIASRLNALGARGARKEQVWWRETHVRRILRNEAYRGIYYVHRYDARSGNPGWQAHQRPREEWIAIPVPAIVDGDTWEAAQRKLARQGRVRGRRKPGMYLLSGLARCGRCGASVAGNVVGGKHRYYTCTMRGTRVEPGRRCGRNYPADAVEAAVWAEVRRWLDRPEEFAAVLRGSLPDEERARLEAEARALDERLVHLQRGRDTVLRLVREGAVTPDEAAEALRQSRADIEAVRRRREEVMAVLARHDLGERDVAALEEARRALADALDHLTDAEWGQVVRLLVSVVVLYDNYIVLHAQVPVSRPKAAVTIPTGLRHI